VRYLCLVSLFLCFSLSFWRCFLVVGEGLVTESLKNKLLKTTKQKGDLTFHKSFQLFNFIS